MGVLPPDWWKQPRPPRGLESPHFDDAVACFEAVKTRRPEIALLLAFALTNTRHHAEGLALLRQLRRERKDDPVLALPEAAATRRKNGKLGDWVPGPLLPASPLADVQKLAAAFKAMENKDWKTAEKLCREVAGEKNPGRRINARIGLAAAFAEAGTDGRRHQGVQRGISTPAEHSFRVRLPRPADRANRDLKAAETSLAGVYSRRRRTTGPDLHH